MQTALHATSAAAAHCWRAITRWLHIQLLRYQIREQERWLADCRADGLEDSLHLRLFRQQTQEMRVRLYALGGQE